MTLGEAFEPALSAAKVGEEWAWSVLYRHLAGPVTGYLRGHGAPDYEDLASETFLQVAKGIHSFEGDEAAFRSWVFVIAHRRLIDARRKTFRRPAMAGSLADEADPDRLQGGDVEEDAMARLNSEGVQAALAPLTGDQRDVILLRVIAGQSVAETAKILGKSDGAVRVLQHRAIEALRRGAEGQA
ncbi:MAG: sigma-70 family RNA polymerase sigma factor [Demequinaceae bacterium]|nr:sigma-70 family RNA polymerase sigma factor [Demequinaceae bacterium]